MSGGGKFVTGAVLAALGVAWPITSVELANSELREDLRDIAADKAARIGLTGPNSDDDLRSAVIRAASEHGIRLAPENVTVQHRGAADLPTLYVAVDYDASVKALGMPLVLHFNISSGR